MLLRIAVFVLLVWLVYLGVRAIRRNFKQFFDQVDEDKKMRDQKDRAQGNIVDLKKDPKTGIYTPKDDDK